MKYLYGAVYTENNRYILASLRRNESGVWELDKSKQFGEKNKVWPFLQGNRGICFGISSWWRPRSSNRAPDKLIVAQHGDSENRPDYLCSPAAHEIEINLHRELLRSNLIGMAPDTVFLATLPRGLLKNSASSFVSMYGNSRYYIIGITINGALAVSYRMSPGAVEKLHGLLGRIKRHWDLQFREVPFPETFYTIGDASLMPDSAFETPPVHVAEHIKDLALLKAMGTALTPEFNAAPLFEKQTPEASNRKKRTLAYAVSAGLILLGICMTAALAGINLYYKKMITSYETEYQNVIGHNREIKNLTKKSIELAETIMRLQNTFSRQTAWGQFFNILAGKRPDDLYFDRLGSEPDKKNKDIIRIALSGWTTQENSVTDFIATLQGLPYVSQITLSSLERDKKKDSLYRFKIICSLLSNDY